MEAFRHCDAELVGFVDADGATPPNELLRLADASKESDGAIREPSPSAAVLPRRRDTTRHLTSAFTTSLDCSSGCRMPIRNAGRKFCDTRW